MYSHADIETLTTDSQTGIYTWTNRQTETDTQTRRKTVRQTDRQINK